jgi:hypothetical protein
MSGIKATITVEVLEPEAVDVGKLEAGNFALVYDGGDEGNSVRVLVLSDPEKAHNLVMGLMSGIVEWGLPREEVLAAVMTGLVAKPPETVEEKVWYI